MKRYVHAAFDPSMPDWLKKKLGDRFGSFKGTMLRKYRIALDRAQFLPHAASNHSIPIYNLESDYGQVVYAPGVNDDETAYFNGRNRKLGSLAKSKLPEMANDVVFVDMEDTNNTFAKKDKYRDPRYSYRSSDRGDYAGQYKRAPYIGDGEYGPEEWTETGKHPSNERRARDKSGYRIPSPEEKVANYYMKFPERMTNKVDSVYERLLEVRSELASADLTVNSSNISRAYRFFSDAVDEYNSLLSRFDDAEGERKLRHRYRMDPDYYTAEFSQLARRIKDDLDEVEKLIAG